MQNPDKENVGLGIGGLWFNRGAVLAGTGFHADGGLYLTGSSPATPGEARGGLAMIGEATIGP